MGSGREDGWMCSARPTESCSRRELDICQLTALARLRRRGYVIHSRSTLQILDMRLAFNAKGEEDEGDVNVLK